MPFHSLLPAVFSPSWCNRLIARSAAMGFAPAAVAVHGKREMIAAIRNNDRLEFTDAALALEIGAALAASAEGLLSAAAPGRGFAGVGDGFRIYRYVPGQYFKPHRDGDVEAAGTTGLVTVLIYLNDVDGGETIVMPDGYSQRDSWITIAPRQGDVLLFSHDLWHEGRPVATGQKFVLRTDLFYL